MINLLKEQPYLVTDIVRKLGLDTVEDVLGELLDLEKRGEIIKYSRKIPKGDFYLNLYTTKENEELCEVTMDEIFENSIDLFETYRETTPLYNSHREVVEVIKSGALLLGDIQNKLIGVQSKDGIRGRVTELVDMKVLTRSYYTLRDTKTGDEKQLVYHTLTKDTGRLKKYIENKVAATKGRMEFVTDEIEDNVLELLNSRPMFVCELASILGTTNSKLESVLREMVTKGKLHLQHQSHLTVGKNGLFIVYIGEQEPIVKKMVDELRDKYQAVNSQENIVKQLLDVMGEDEAEFEIIHELLGYSEALTVAIVYYALRKGSIERVNNEDDYVFGVYRRVA